MPLLPPFRSQVAAWISKDPTLSKNDKYWLLWEKFSQNFKNVQFCILNLTKFFQFIGTQNVKNVQFLRPYFRKKKKKISFLDPISALRSGHPYSIKSWVPPGFLSHSMCFFFCKIDHCLGLAKNTHVPRYMPGDIRVWVWIYLAGYPSLSVNREVLQVLIHFTMLFLIFTSYDKCTK